MGRQAILYGAGDLRLEPLELDPGTLEPDQILAETEVTALSTGTDLGNYLGDSTYVPGAPPYPRPVGYSNVSRIAACGSAVSRWRVGQRVFSMKSHRSGFITGQNDMLVAIPDAVSSETASLAYLTQLGLAGLRQTRYETGENVLVIGLGVIGLGTVSLARAMGARVVGLANSALRAEAAVTVGAHAAFQSGTPDLPAKLKEAFGGGDADIVILTANPWSAYKTALECAGDGGRISLLGFPGRGEPPADFNPLDPRWIYAKQLAIFGSGHSPRTDCPPNEIRFNLRRNLEYIFSLMASGDMNLTSLISHRIPAERMVEAYELARMRSKELVAAVFQWRE